MDSKTRSQFRNLFRNLEDAGYEVNRMMTRLARNLRNYVSSEQFAEDRRMIELLRDTRRLAAEAAEAEELSPTKRMETPLQRIGMAVSSVAQMKLADPGAEVITSDVKRFEASEGDAEALLELVRESEIDLEELSAAVADAVAELGKPSIADVLEHHPATQGLASVVGLVYLAMRFGVQLDGRESVRFEEDDGAVRLATLPLFTFDTTSVEEMR